MGNKDIRKEKKKPKQTKDKPKDNTGFESTRHTAGQVIVTLGHDVILKS